MVRHPSASVVNKLKIQEISAKSVLSKSKVYDYAVNPYRGCSHACRYCYAAFMRRFTGHREPWGDFVDVKINAPEVLANEINRKPIGTVWVSGSATRINSREEVPADPKMS